MRTYSSKIHRQRKELEDLNRANSILQQENKRLRSDLAHFGHSDQQNIESVRSDPPTKSDRMAQAAIWLDFFTLILIIVTAGGTWYTIHTQDENRFLPLLVLGTQDDFTANQHTIVIRNIGFGPALNAATTGISIAHAKTIAVQRLVEKNKEWSESSVPLTVSEQATLRLNHRRAVAVNETQDIDGREQDTGQTSPEEKLTVDMNKPPWKRVTTVGNIVAILAGEQRQVFCISYQNARAEQYETWQVMTMLDKGDLGIDYICQRKTSYPCSDTKKNIVLNRLSTGVPTERACPE
jgi:hypothetical protein